MTNNQINSMIALTAQQTIHLDHDPGRCHHGMKQDHHDMKQNCLTSNTYRTALYNISYPTLTHQHRTAKRWLLFLLCVIASCISLNVGVSGIMLLFIFLFNWYYARAQHLILTSILLGTIQTNRTCLHTLNNDISATTFTEH